MTFSDLTVGRIVHWTGESKGEDHGCRAALVILRHESRVVLRVFVDASTATARGFFDTEVNPDSSWHDPRECGQDGREKIPTGRWIELRPDAPLRICSTTTLGESCKNSAMWVHRWPNNEDEYICFAHHEPTKPQGESR